MMLYEWKKGTDRGVELTPGMDIRHGDDTSDGKVRLELNHRAEMTNRRAHKGLKPTKIIQLMLEYRAVCKNATDLRDYHNNTKQKVKQ